MTTCVCCGRWLTDPISVALRMGPVCRIRQKEIEVRNHSLFAGCASFTVELVDGVICIVDLDDGPSVTNSAEAVIADVGRQGFDLSLPVIYRDTMGVWDRLLVSGGKFSGFASVNETDRTLAVAKVKGMQ